MTLASWNRSSARRAMLPSVHDGWPSSRRRFISSLL